MKFEKLSDNRTLYTLDGVSKLGGKVQIEFAKVIVEQDNPKDVAVQWYKNGTRKDLLENWWYVLTFCYDEKGYCWGVFNPTHETVRNHYGNVVRVQNHDWTLPATDENRDKIIEEIKRLAGLVNY